MRTWRVMRLYNIPLHSRSLPNRINEAAIDNRTKQRVTIQTVPNANCNLSVAFTSAGVKVLIGLPHPWANAAQANAKFVSERTWLNHQQRVGTAVADTTYLCNDDEPVVGIQLARAFHTRPDTRDAKSQCNDCQDRYWDKVL